MSDGKNYLNWQKGIKSWLFTLDHKRIAILYMITVFSFFFIGGVFAILIRLELFKVGETIMKSAFYNQVMTYHGAIMVFMVIIPGIPAFLGNFALPLQIGAKDVAFPKINLLSWYCLVIGACVTLLSLFLGGVDTGWTFYTPYSIKTGTAVIPVVLGVFIMGFSSILTGLNFIVTIHKLRVPGMSFFRMPLFVWSLYSTAIIQVLATPVLAITLLLLIGERVLGIGFFNPDKGGDPVLFQHFFWFYSHPAVYIMILPAMGVVSELIAAFSRQRIFGYKSVVFASLGIAAVSFFVWGHHLFVSGQSDLAGIIFSFLTFLVGVPTAVKIFNWVVTMFMGSLKFDTPFLYALGFLFLFLIGGVTGIMLAVLPFDVHVHDTYFVVAHFHYVMVGGTIMGIMGGFYYWFPKMFGRLYNELVGQISFLFIFIGFNVTFFPQFILGFSGMPRRYADYIPPYEPLNQVSTIGSWFIALGFIIAFTALIRGMFKGEKAENNPWGAKTLEWTAGSPPPHENFLETPKVTKEAYE